MHLFHYILFLSIVIHLPELAKAACKVVVAGNTCGTHTSCPGWGASSWKTTDPTPGHCSSGTRNGAIRCKAENGWCLASTGPGGHVSRGELYSWRAGWDCCDVCSCSNGSPATGAACTTNGGAICGSCNSGYYLSGVACPLDQRCTCANGSPVVGVTCQKYNTNNPYFNHCNTCNANYYWYRGSCVHCTVCAAGTYETTACNTLSGTYQDRACTPYSCTCSNGYAATGASCTSNIAKCSSCYNNYYLSGTTCYLKAACTTCSTGQHQTSGCTNTANRICYQNSCSCNYGAAATGTSCTSNNAAICTVCDYGHYLSGTSCPLDNRCTCANGSPVVGGTCQQYNQNGNVAFNRCNICNTNFYWYTGSCVSCLICSTGTYESTSCSTSPPSQNRACTAYSCTCSNGAAATGASCTSDGAKCGSCNNGFYLNGNVCTQIASCTACGAGKRETSGCTNENNRACDVCASGMYQSSNTFTGTSCVACDACGSGKKQTKQCDTTTNNRVCNDCDAGEYQSSNTFTGTSCSLCTACVAGEKQITQCATTANNRVCGNCLDGRYQTSDSFTGEKCFTCAATCSGDTYETTACTSNSNRACSSCTSTCSGDTYETMACTSNNNRACSTCTSTCSEDTYETTACTSSSNRVCSLCTSTCTGTTYESTACSSTTNRVCTQNICTCSKGVISTGTSCTTHNTNICASCNNGYFLSGPSCLPYEGSCINGDLITQSSRTIANHCGTCDIGYHLSDTAITDKGADGCTSSQQCAKCEGDCDKDSDCKGELKCYQRILSDAIVPGCSSTGHVKTSGGDHDYCYSTEDSLLILCLACASGMYQSSNTFTGTSCVTCDECDTGKTQTTQCSPTANDRVCSDFECTCIGGTGATGLNCPTDGDAKCISCNDGTSKYLQTSDSSCQPWKKCDVQSEYESVSPSTTVNRECVDKQCSCDNGVGFTASNCPNQGAFKCESCIGEYILNDDDTCKAWTICEDSEYSTTIPSEILDRSCAIKKCTCDMAGGATAAVGTACDHHGNEKCTACVGEYFLDVTDYKCKNALTYMNELISQRVVMQNNQETLELAKNQMETEKMQTLVDLEQCNIKLNGTNIVKADKIIKLNNCNKREQEKITALNSCNNALDDTNIIKADKITELNNCNTREQKKITELNNCNTREQEKITALNSCNTNKEIGVVECNTNTEVVKQIGIARIAKCTSNTIHVRNECVRNNTVWVMNHKIIVNNWMNLTMELNRTKIELQTNLKQMTQKYKYVEIALAKEKNKNNKDNVEAINNNTTNTKTIELLNAALETKQKELQQSQWNLITSSCFVASAVFLFMLFCMCCKKFCCCMKSKKVPLPPKKQKILPRRSIHGRLKDSAHNAIHLQRGLINIKKGFAGLQVHAKKTEVQQKASSARLAARLRHRERTKNRTNRSLSMQAQVTTTTTTTTSERAVVLFSADENDSVSNLPIHFYDCTTGPLLVEKSNSITETVSIPMNLTTKPIEQTMGQTTGLPIEQTMGQPREQTIRQPDHPDYQKVQTMLKRMNEQGKLAKIITRISSKKSSTIKMERLKALLKKFKVSNPDSLISFMLTKLSNDNGITISTNRFRMFCGIAIIQHPEYECTRTLFGHLDEQGKLDRIVKRISTDDGQNIKMRSFKKVLKKIKCRDVNGLSIFLLNELFGTEMDTYSVEKFRKWVEVTRSATRSSATRTNTVHVVSSVKCRRIQL